MKAKRILAILTSAILSVSAMASLAGCGTVEDAKEPTSSDSKPNTPSDSENPPVQQLDYTSLSKGFTRSADIVAMDVKDLSDEFISSQYAFSAELFKQSFSDSENTLVSPTSVMQALAMTANGANGQTLTEMQNVLGGGMSMNELNEYLFSYAQSLDSTSENAKLNIANSIWFRDTERLTVKDSFLQTNADYFGAEAVKDPFEPSVVDLINSWISLHTDGMIDKMLSQPPSDETMMYLVNAIVFDAKWADAYEDYQVSDHDFTDYLGNVLTVDMMSSTEEIYLEDNIGGAKGFMKYYDGGKYAFAALLPDENVSIESYVNSLTGESLAQALTPVDRDVTVWAKLPAFSFDYNINMTEPLQDMGIKAAFRDDADFSSITEDMPLCISAVLHKTHIEVDKDGTKAAAATVVVMDEECTAVIEPDEIVEITLDRPFVFAIVDTQTHLPVFIGTTLTIDE